MRFDNWHEALSTLAGLTAEGKVIVLSDEISWLASRDKDFAGKLKGAWDTPGRKKALSKYRIRDNYLRFYLRYMNRQKEKIEQGLSRDVHLENLVNWDAVMGCQFESLILNNLDAVLRCLDIPPESIISAAPY